MHYLRYFCGPINIEKKSSDPTRIMSEFVSFCKIEGFHAMNRNHKKKKKKKISIFFI